MRKAVIGGNHNPQNCTDSLKEQATVGTRTQTVRRRTWYCVGFGSKSSVVSLTVTSRFDTRRVISYFTDRQNRMIRYVLATLRRYRPVVYGTLLSSLREALYPKSSRLFCRHLSRLTTSSPIRVVAAENDEFILLRRSRRDTVRALLTFSNKHQ